MSTTIYNTTDGPLTIDRAGRQLGGRESRPVESVDGSPLAGHIAAGRILVLEQQTADDEAPTEQQPAKRGRRTTDTQEA